MRIFLLGIIFLVFLIFAIPVMSSSQLFDEKYPVEDRMEGEVFTLSWEPGTDLKRLNRNIRIKRIPGYRILDDIKKKEPRDQVFLKLHFLFQRVANILNMSLKSGKKIKIYVFGDNRSLQEAISRCLSDHKESVFIRGKNIIYIASDNINEYVLAHEMAHAIIDNYFIVSPPSNVHEILAVHCDLHLRDQDAG